MRYCDFPCFSYDKSLRKNNFIGFTVLFTNPDGKKFPISNRIRFEGQPEAKFTSSEYAPFQTFNWLHITGNLKGVLNKTPYGVYKYEISPRYINYNGKLETIDAKYRVELFMEVKPFKKGFLDIAFTRGYVVEFSFYHMAEGIHDIHMNQGSVGAHAGSNGIYQDGGIIIHFPSHNKWTAIFLKFESQAIQTDERGNSI